MTRLFNVRLSDEEYGRLQMLADGRRLSMSALVKAWITQPPAGRTDHAACDAKIAELEAARRVEVPLDFLRDNRNAGNVVAEITRRPSPPITIEGTNIVVGAKPAFLAAPDDDCTSCGHDRHTYHLAGVCTCPTGIKTKCGCPAFVSAAEPF